MTILVTGAIAGLGQSIVEVPSKKVPVSEIAVLVSREAKGEPFVA